MKFLKRFLRFFSAKTAAHPKLASFDALSSEERLEVLKYEAKEFSKKYGSVIKALAKE